ncbi:hypothetical protein ACFYRW_23395 [Rhodococcus pyridinivorans]
MASTVRWQIQPNPDVAIRAVAVAGEQPPVPICDNSTDLRSIQ